MNLDYFRLLYNYNYWAHRQVWECVLTLTDEQYARDTGYSWRSIRGQLVHVMGAELIWFTRIKGESPKALLAEADFPTRDRLRAEWDRVEGMVRGTVDSLTDGRIAAQLKYRNTAGEEFSQPLWQILLHVINHSTDHRAQVLAMLWQIGAPTVEQDLIRYVRQSGAK